MAVTINFFGQTLMSLLRKEQHWLNDEYKVALITSAVAPVKDTTLNFTGFTEISTTGYTAGGNVLANKTLTYNTSTDVVNIDCDDFLWASLANATFRYAIIYNNTVVAKPVLCWIDFGEDVVVIGSKFEIVFAATLGAFTVL